MRHGIRNFAAELQYQEQGFAHVFGCDEVGRGCLAGPVVAAMVLFDWSKPNVIIDLAERVRIDDSKRLSALQRQKARDAILEVALGYGVGMVDPATIDKINVLQASFMAMRQAFDDLGTRFERPQSFMILVDGNATIPKFNYPQKAVIDGDAKIFSIAAASIIAKVYRDDIMVKEHEQYPQYGWDANKGYGTPVHMQALKEHGLTPLHRRTFCHRAE